VHPQYPILAAEGHQAMREGHWPASTIMPISCQCLLAFKTSACITRPSKEAMTVHSKAIARLPELAQLTDSGVAHNYLRALDRYASYQKVSSLS
jgi:hypothetical protein